MAISIERQATLANGFLILSAVTIALIPATRVMGICCTGLMGFFQIFSGVTGYCGWKRILPRLYTRLGFRNE